MNDASNELEFRDGYCLAVDAYESQLRDMCSIYRESFSASERVERISTLVSAWYGATPGVQCLEKSTSDIADDVAYQHVYGEHDQKWARV